MNLLTLLLRLPLLPLTGFISLAETIADEAERELHDPARIRRELDELQREQESGQISAEEAAEREDSLAATMVSRQPGSVRRRRG